MGWSYLGILFGVSLIICLCGFYKYVYFLSIGYGFSVAGIGVTLLVMGLAGVLGAANAATDVAMALLCVLLLVYGLRLSGFLLLRELKNAAYRKTLQEVAGDEKAMPILVKISIWLCVALLYVGQTSPVYFALYNGAAASACTWAGIVICVLAIWLEAESDRQKSAQKKERPDMVAMAGLYKIVRCPNYLGEILFWTGILVSGLSALQGIGQWVTAILAYICIVFVMFNGAQRLEKRQMARYGENEEYQAYVNKTPILIPLVPLYHLNKTSK